MTRKGFAGIVIVIALVFALAGSGFLYYYLTHTHQGMITPQKSLGTNEQSVSDNTCTYDFECGDGNHCAPDPKIIGNLESHGEGICAADQYSTVNGKVIFSITYVNTAYGFNYSLPSDWKEYVIETSTWQGSNSDGGNKTTGTDLRIEKPSLVKGSMFYPIVIRIFTIKQWNDYEAGKFYTSAAPVSDGEIARNNRYVFALPARWAGDGMGAAEAEAIVGSNPLRPIDIK